MSLCFPASSCQYLYTVLRLLITGTQEQKLSPVSGHIEHRENSRALWLGVSAWEGNELLVSVPFRRGDTVPNLVLVIHAGRGNWEGLLGC